MKTPWIPEGQLARALERNEAFWRNELDGGPLLWVTAPDARTGPVPPEPAAEEELWTDPGYVVASAESVLSRTHHSGDALPVFCPWLGPDQFAGWLGAELRLRPRDSTSWSEPFVADWSEHGEFGIDPENRWWKLYLRILRESVRAGRDRWITGYPDLHSGIDALSAARGPENLAVDLLRDPEAVRRAMARMTELWKQVVDEVSGIVLPAGQGTSNWTMGWSASRFLCIGQNDFACMIGREMFEEFCLRDTVECCEHADVSIYHLDGPGAVRHVPALIRIEKLSCIQWIQGAGRPLPSKWIPLLREIQEGGKSVQVYYGGSHGGDADLEAEADALCAALDPDRLFIWAEVGSAEEAEAVVAHARRAGRRGRGRGQSRSRRRSLGRSRADRRGRSRSRRSAPGRGAGGGAGKGGKDPGGTEP